MQVKKKDILFLTTNNLATNPRLFKEVKLALGLDYEVSLVIFRLGNWSDTQNDLLELEIADYKVQIIEIKATSDVKFQWLKWGLLEKIARIIFPLFKRNLLINALASSRRSLQIFNACYKIEIPDLIIAHNLGAAYPAYKLSKFWKIPFIFDVEDYHPGEMIVNDAKNEKARRKFLLKTMLPKAAAITSASPLINEYTLNLIGGHSKHQTVLNGFPQEEFNRSSSTTTSLLEPLKLVWFSQKISFGRGLEQLFEALIILNNSLKHHQRKTILMSLTLIGDIDSAFYQQKVLPFKKSIEFSNQKTSQFLNQSIKGHAEKSHSIQLKIMPPLSQKELHHQLANFDVGLALEFNNTDLNRQLCLTNKIIAYSQAGLYILATDTPAQRNFLNKNPNSGLLCGQTDRSISTALLELINKSSDIKNNFIQRYEKGQSLAWEKESIKLSSLWATFK